MKRNAQLSISVLIATLLITPLSLHAAGVYKWVDENGKVHFGDKPNNATAQQVPIRPAPPPDPNLQKRREQGDKLLQVQAEERELKDEEMAKARQTEEEREQQCIQAKAQLKDYERARYLYKPEKNGEETILSDEERKTRTEEVKKSIEELCS